MYNEIMYGFIPYPPLKPIQKSTEVDNKEAIYSIDQLDVMIDMLTERFLKEPETYHIRVEYGRISAIREDQLGNMYLTIPDGYPKYVQLYIGGAHSWTDLTNGWLPFANHKTRTKVKHLARLMKDKNELLIAQAQQKKRDEMIKNANEAFMKAFPEITDLLLENKDGKSSN